MPSLSESESDSEPISAWAHGTAPLTSEGGGRGALQVCARAPLAVEVSEAPVRRP
jgi:hypothetical protein